MRNSTWITIIGVAVLVLVIGLVSGFVTIKTQPAEDSSTNSSAKIEYRYIIADNGAKTTDNGAAVVADNGAKTTDNGAAVVADNGAKTTDNGAAVVADNGEEEKGGEIK